MHQPTQVPINMAFFRSVPAINVEHAPKLNNPFKGGNDLASRNQVAAIAYLSDERVRRDFLTILKPVLGHMTLGHEALRVAMIEVEFLRIEMERRSAAGRWRRVRNFFLRRLGKPELASPLTPFFYVGDLPGTITLRVASEEDGAPIAPSSSSDIRSIDSAPSKQKTSDGA
jgi:hypothetical protein